MLQQAQQRKRVWSKTKTACCKPKGKNLCNSLFTIDHSLKCPILKDNTNNG